MKKSLAICIILLTMGALGCGGLKKGLVGDPVVATDNARQAFDDLNLGWEWLGAHAANSDSDADGYISVMVAARKYGDEVVILNWQCGGGKAISYVSGCKVRPDIAFSAYVSGGS